MKVSEIRLNASNSVWFPFVLNYLLIFLARDFPYIYSRFYEKALKISKQNIACFYFEMYWNYLLFIAMTTTWVMRLVLQAEENLQISWSANLLISNQQENLIFISRNLATSERSYSVFPSHTRIPDELLPSIGENQSPRTSAYVPVPLDSNNHLSSCFHPTSSQNPRGKPASPLRKNTIVTTLTSLKKSSRTLSPTRFSVASLVLCAAQCVNMPDIKLAALYKLQIRL